MKREIDWCPFCDKYHWNYADGGRGEIGSGWNMLWDIEGDFGSVADTAEGEPTEAEDVEEGLSLAGEGRGVLALGGSDREAAT